MSSAVLLHFWEGARSALSRPLRSALTALTCAVAIAVTVNVISLDYGMDEDIRRDLSRFGRTTLDVGRTPFVVPGTAKTSFGPAELERIRAAVADLDAKVVPGRQRPVSLEGEATAPRVALAAVPAEFPSTLDLPLAAGRFLRPSEKGFSACVLDETVANKVFPGRSMKDVVGKTVRIHAGAETHETPVVGILADPMTYRALFDAFDENRASRALSSVLLAFRNVYVPEDAVPGEELSFVSVVLPDDARVDQAMKRLSALWPAVDFEDPDSIKSPISVLKRRDWIETVGTTSQAGAFIGNIVWILIVVVACVMVSTLSLISVRERYDEIAVRRCEGATKGQLGLAMAGENVVTAVAGGLLGLPLGYLGAEALRSIVDFPFRFEARYAAFAMLVALGLGLLSAWVPARRAAGLDPARVLSRRLT